MTTTTSSSTTTTSRVVALMACMLLALLPVLSQAFLLPAAPLHHSTTTPRTSSSTCSSSGRVLHMSAAATMPPAAAAAAAARPRREINILQLVESNGGYLARVQVKNFKDITEHTVITSKELYHTTCAMAGKDDGSFSIEEYFKAVFKYMIGKGMSLARTEGMIDAGLFPINYFSVSQLAIFMDDTVEGVAEVIKGM